MNSPQRPPLPTEGLSGKVAVVGAGVSGLAAAHRLRELAPEVTVRLLEATGSVGGILRTEQRGGYLIEHGADSLLTRDPWGIALCRRLDFESELIPTDGRYRRAFVVCRGRLLPVPAGFVLLQPRDLVPVLASPILSWRAKWRLMREYWVPVRGAADEESIADFAVRRLGRETYERLVQPLVGGIYTGDPRRLSMAATLPRFVAAEREHGSLIRAAARSGQSASGDSDAGAGYSQFVAPRQGMAQLAAAIAERLPPGVIRCDRQVTALRSRSGDGWSVIAATETDPWECDGLILATPARVAGRLLASIDRQLEEDLVGLPRAGASIVTLGYPRSQIGHRLDGFGLVVPQVERRRILAASFSSVKFAGRAPPGRELIRVFFGGALQPELNALDDQSLSTIAHEELRDLLGVCGAPELVAVSRWEGSMPQYEVGHQARVAAIESRVVPYRGLELAGNAYRGVGVPACIHSGEQAAERIVTMLHERAMIDGNS